MADIRDFPPIPLGIIDAELTAEELERSRLSKEALGGFWYLDEPNDYLHGPFRIGWAIGPSSIPFETVTISKLLKRFLGRAIWRRHWHYAISWR